MTKKIDFYSIPIVDYLTSIGEPLVSVGRNYWQHESHDSLKINIARNYFVWNSRSGEKNSKGGVVQYLQIMYDMTLKQALDKIEKDLTKVNITTAKIKPKKYPKKFVYKVEEVNVPLEAQRYLVAERKIPNNVVKYFFEIGFISQNSNQEIVFKWTKGAEIVGFTKQGTKKLTEEQKEQYKTKLDYFKYVAPTTEKYTYWGFNYMYGMPRNLYFFESPIDLLSYYALHEKELEEQGDYWLISIDGVAIQKVLNFIKYLKEIGITELSSLNVCFDNDNAGASACKELEKIEVYHVPFVDARPKNQVDWNDVLKSKGVNGK